MNEEEVREAAFGEIDAAMSGIFASTRSVLEAVGTLVAIGCGSDSQIDAALGSRSRNVLSSVMSHLDYSELDDASIIIMRDGPTCLTMDPECFDEEMREVIDALRIRDRVELEWMGAERLGLVEDFSGDAVSARGSFDECVSTDLWQLVPLGDLRTTEVLWMQPCFHQRFWWRSRGAQFTYDSILTQMEAFLKTFPDARQMAEQLQEMGHVTNPG